MTAQSSTASRPAGRRSRTKARAPKAVEASKAASNDAAPTKLDLIVSLLARPGGASLADLTKATGWQAHSVRGALAGSLKKKGHRIVSEKVDPEKSGPDKSGGLRRYRIADTK